MDSLFTYRDEIEGKVGIGRLPNDLLDILDDISKEYYSIIPDKNKSTYHTWYEDMPPSIKSKIEQIQKHNFWDKLCDGSEKCVKISANEMDELYYSNPKNKLDKINLYGASGNYVIHRDNVYFSFYGINFYRILIGLTDGNNNIITYFNNLNVEHKINKGDYIVFDFDKSSHQVIKDREEMTPRILFKMHFLLCENCNYSKEYLTFIKSCYLNYEFITRYFMQVGTDPETYYQFFCGLYLQFNDNPITKYIIFLIIFLIIILLKIIFKIKLIYKNISKIVKYTLLSLIVIYLIIVFFYWIRYKIFGIK
jgi:hypothetical protein